MGSVLLEAMQHKTAIIATAVGGIVDIIQDYQNDILIPPDQPHILAQKIELLAKDKHLRTDFIQNSEHALKRFSPECIANAYLKLYQDLAKD